MKKLLAIIVLGLLFSGNANAARYMWQDGYVPVEKRRLYILLSNKKNETVDSVINSSKFSQFDDKFKCPNGIVKKKLDPPTGTMIELAGKPNSWLDGEYHPIRAWELSCKNKIQSNQSASKGISFTIKDKKEQCAAIGFKPQTEKFADCVLKLVELDIKSQANNRTVATQNNSNQQIAKELEKQNNLRQSQFLMNLSKQLLTPNAPASLPSTSNCTVRGTGVNKSITCY